MWAEDWTEDVIQQLRQPLRESDRGELRSYFERLKDGHRSTPATGPDARLIRCCAAFGGPRFRALYRAWVADGDRVLDVASSRAIVRAVAAGAGVVEPVLLSHGFRHLSFLVTGADERRSRAEGAKLGDEAPQRLQPRSLRGRDRQEDDPTDVRPSPLTPQPTIPQPVARLRFDERAARLAAWETERP